MNSASLIAPFHSTTNPYRAYARFDMRGHARHETDLIEKVPVFELQKIAVEHRAVDIDVAIQGPRDAPICREPLVR